MCLLKGNVQASYGDDAHRMKIQCESIYIHTAIEEKLQWHFWCQRSLGILNIDFLGTVGITKIELILGAGKKISNCHASTSMIRGKNIYYRHGISLFGFGKEKTLWQFLEEKNGNIWNEFANV